MSSYLDSQIEKRTMRVDCGCQSDKPEVVCVPKRPVHIPTSEHSILDAAKKKQCGCCGGDDENARLKALLNEIIQLLSLTSKEVTSQDILTAINNIVPKLSVDLGNIDTSIFALEETTAKEETLNAMARDLNATINDTVNDTVKDAALGLAQTRDLPISIVFNGNTYKFGGFECINDKIWVRWDGVDDIFTLAVNGAVVGTNVYNNTVVANPQPIGTVSAINKVTLADIYDRIGNIDFSTLAKQGSNVNATNTAILEAIRNIQTSVINTYNVNIDDYAAQLRAIIGVTDSQVGEVA